MNELATFVVSRTESWKLYRDNNYKENWDRYYRKFRGIHKPQDKETNSERSQFISPASQQAVEAAVAEQEEALFGRKVWFDIEDNIGGDEEIEGYRGLLAEDMERDGVRSSTSESILNGALYGTGIGKIIVEEVESKSVGEVPVEGTNTTEVKAVSQKVVRVVPIPIDPKDFVIDPAAKWPNIEDCMGCAHIFFTQRYKIEKGIREGFYKDVPVTSMDEDTNTDALGEAKAPDTGDKVKITEYFGLVPENLLNPKEKSALPEEDEDQGPMVEAIVTVLNDSEILKAVKNPYLMQDRPIIAFPYDKIPNRFWGRGVSEKGFNAQCALDSELRARHDALGLSAHPMVGIDASKLPRGFRFKVGPGKTLLSNGPPSETFMPFKFPGPDPATFTQGAEYERMIQMGTGSMDSAQSISGNARNATASGMSMMLSGSVKRQKRTTANLNEHYINPMIQKILWRYMQFDPKRYPAKDYTFTAKATLGLMAREFEQSQMTNLLAIVPPESPVFLLLSKGIFENSSLSNKDEIMPVIDQMLQSAMNPQPDPMQEQVQQMEIAKLGKELEKVQSEIDKNNAMAQSELTAEEQTALKILEGNLKLRLEKLKQGQKVDPLEISGLEELMAVLNEGNQANLAGVQELGGQMAQGFQDQGEGLQQGFEGLGEGLGGLQETLEAPVSVERDEQGNVTGAKRG